jgi:hypothetical protein
VFVVAKYCAKISSDLLEENQSIPKRECIEAILNPFSQKVNGLFVSSIKKFNFKEITKIV